MPVSIIYTKKPKNGPGQTVICTDDPPVCHLDILATKDRAGFVLTFSIKHRALAQRLAKLTTAGDIYIESMTPKGTNT